MIRLSIITNNIHYSEIGVEDGRYHEIHSINMIHNFQHAILSITSVIQNNLLSGCDDTMLSDVSVRSSDLKLIDDLKIYYDMYPSKVKVYIEYDPAMN